MVERVNLGFEQVTVTYTPQGSTGAKGGGDVTFEADAYSRLTVDARSERFICPSKQPNAPSATATSTRRCATCRSRSASILPTPKLRVFLFQLLCVLGQWERALTQLNVAAELDAQALAMAQMYREALQCEMPARRRVRRASDRR